MNFTVDAANNPIVVYNQVLAGGNGSRIGARRYSGGAWAPIGPNNGVLPNVVRSPVPAETCSAHRCTGAPLVAYAAYMAARCVRPTFQRTSWCDLAAGLSKHDLSKLDINVDASGRPVLVASDSNAATRMPIASRRRPGRRWTQRGDWRRVVCCAEVYPAHPFRRKCQSDCGLHRFDRPNAWYLPPAASRSIASTARHGRPRADSGRHSPTISPT